MKKNQFFSFITLLLVSVFIFSCNKSDRISSPKFSSDTENDLKRNEATWLNVGSEKKLIIGLRWFSGHTADQCGGKCVEIFGEYMHIDCRGFGNICNYSVVAELSGNITDDKLVLMLKDYESLGEFEIFPFPDRSFTITNPQNSSELWLNIPEQILSLDSAQQQVVIHNIWFSEEQELENK